MGIFDTIIDGIGDALAGTARAVDKARDRFTRGNPGSHGSHNPGPGPGETFTGGDTFVSATFTPEFAAAKGPTYGQAGNRSSVVGSGPSFTPERVADRAKPIFRGGE